MRIAFVGAGRMAAAMARIFFLAGHGVFLSYSRHPDRLSRLAREIGCSSGSAQQAIAFGEIVVLSVGWTEALRAAESLGDLRGKILWSIVTPLKADYSGLEVGTETSGSEEIARRVRNARFVSGWPLFAEMLQSKEQSLSGEKATTFYCGDDPEAKAAVAGLMRSLGSDAVDAGSLISARLIEPTMMLLVSLAYRQKMGAVAFKLLRGK